MIFAHLIALLTLAAGQTPPLPVPPDAAPAMTLGADVKLGSLEIPDEIASAVLPYMLCRNASQGVPVFANGERVPDPTGAVKDADCSGVRAAAAKNADKLLRQSGAYRRAERAEIIETTLASIDRFTDWSTTLPVEPGEHAED